MKVVSCIKMMLCSVFKNEHVTKADGTVEMELKAHIPIKLFLSMVISLFISTILITSYIVAPYKMKKEYVIDITAPRDYVDTLAKAEAIKRNDSVFKTGIPVVIGTAVSCDDGELILIKKSKVDTLRKYWLRDDQIPHINYDVEGYHFTTNTIMSYKRLLYAAIIKNDFESFKIHRDVPNLRQREQVRVGNILVSNIDGSHYARTTTGVIMVSTTDPRLDRLIGKTHLINEYLAERSMHLAKREVSDEEGN